MLERAVLYVVKIAPNAKYPRKTVDGADSTPPEPVYVVTRDHPRGFVNPEDAQASLKAFVEEGRAANPTAPVTSFLHPECEVFDFTLIEKVVTEYLSPYNPWGVAEDATGV